MKSLTSEEQKRRANIFWNNMTEDDHLEFSNKMKSYWTDEKRIEKSNSMNLFYSNVENKIKKSVESKQRWDSLSAEEYLKIKEKMSIVNKDERKRKLAGDKIRELWKDDNYLKKMKQRNTNPGVKIKLIKPDGSEIIIENMRIMTNEYNFSPHLIRKYRDKKIKILKKDLKNENIILLDCIIESIKNIKENG